MPNGGLFQIISAGPHYHSLNLTNHNNAEEYINVNFNEENFGFNKILNIEIPRHSDTINRILFNIKLNAAPNGYHYKKAWYNCFFKKISLLIGGQPIFSYNSNMLQMKHLIQGENGVNELTFNYPSIQERIEKSRNPHEVIVEPLKISELIESGIIRLICLAFHTVQIKIETSSLEDILESDGTLVQPPIQEPQDTFIQSIKPSVLYQSFDTEERRAMAQAAHEDVIKQHTYICEQVSTNNPCNLRLNVDNVCSAMYIWVTDRNNKEIPNQLISNIKIKFSDHLRHNLSGFHCRHINKNHMPHPTIDNDKSQNLYYISYFTERNTQNGAENGVSLSRIDNYSCEINWVNNINMDVNIHFVHRTNDILKIQSGMAGLMFQHNIGQEFARAVVQPFPQPINQPIVQEQIHFENTDQLIDVPEDELCLLTQDKFTEGTEIDYCNGCNKSFTTSMLNEWMSRARVKRCLNCFIPYNNTNFKRGKAHIL